MEGKKVAALLLTFLVAAAETNTVVSKTQSSKWQGLTANLNEYVDNTLALLIPFMQENGLDPMLLPEIHEYVEVKPALITYSARIRLYDGYATGLINIARIGDQYVHYFSKVLRIRLQLQFTDLQFNYRYRAQVMNIGPGGRLIASLNRFAAITDIVVDFNKDEIQLQQFVLTDIGRLSVRLTGSLVSWLLSPIISMFTRIFNSVIMRAVESTINSVAQNALLEINNEISNIVQQLEAANYKSIVADIPKPALEDADLQNIIAMVLGASLKTADFNL